MATTIQHLHAHVEEPIFFDVIIAMNVLGHTADPASFMKACQSVLAPGGRIYVQTSQARMVENAEFDTCYHEHISFFTAKSFSALMTRSTKIVERKPQKSSISTADRICTF